MMFSTRFSAFTLSLACILVSAVFVLVVEAQVKTSPTRGRAAKEADLKEAPPEGTTNSKLLKKTIERLDELDAALALARGQQPPKVERQGKIFGLVEQPGMNSIYMGNNKRTRVLASKLTIVNLSKEKFEIPTNTIVLDEGGKVLKSDNVPEKIKGYSVPVGDNYKNVRDLLPSEKITVPANGLASTWLVFHGLDAGSHIPKMKLKTEIQGKPYSWDINEANRALMKLSVERIGPYECLGYLKIRGETNIINIGSLIDELDLLAAKNVSRVVIEWDEKAKPLPSQLSSNLFQAIIRLGQENRFGRSNEFPDLPSSIREFHIAMSKKINRYSSHYYTSSESRNRIHQSSAEAIGAALRSAFEVLNHDDLVEQIETGHAHIKAAALAYGGKTLTVDDLPLVLSQTESDDLSIKRAALVCLSEFNDPEAIKVLREMCEHKKSEISETAITSLVISRFPEARNTIREILASEDEALRQKVLQMMAKYPRAVWSTEIFEFAKTGKEDIRIEALKAINKIGHPELVSLLKASLEDKNVKVSSSAYSILMSRTDPQSEEIVLEYTLEKIKKEQPSSQMLGFLSRVRDKRVLPLLTRYMDDEKNDRTSLINCLASVGDESTLELLYNSYPKMKKSGEKQAIVSAMLRQDPERFREISKEAIKGKDSSMVRTICNGLQQDGGDDAVRILSGELRRMMGNKKLENTSKASQISSALGVIATPEAREILREVRDTSKNTSFVSYAKNALSNMHSRSAAYTPLYYARNSMKAKQWEKATKQYSISLEIDPEIPEAYIGRADAYYQLAKFKEALADYDKAIELEPKMADVRNKRGHVFTRQRKFAESIDDFNKAIELSPKTAKYYVSRGNALWMQEKFAKAEPDFAKALELDPKMHLALSGVALTMVVQGKVEEGIKKIEDARKNYEKDGGYAYSCACVYSRSVGYLRDHPEIKDAAEKIKKYEKQALVDLEKAIRLGYNDYEWFKNDPDMKAIKDTARFQELMKPAKSSKKSTTSKPTAKKDKEEKADDVIEEINVAPAAFFEANAVAQPAVIKNVVFLPTPPN